MARGCRRAALGAALSCASLIAVSPAAAQAAKLRVQVIGSPYGAGGRTAVPVLISLATARRAHLRGQVGVVLLRRRLTMATREGKVTPPRLRLGDRLVVTTRLTRAVRRSAYVRIVARRARITARAKQLSVAELEELVRRVQRDLAGLTATVDGLGRALRDGLAAVNARIDALEARMSAAEARLAALHQSLSALGDALAAATAGLNARIDGLDADLQGRLDGLADELGTVTAALGSCAQPASVVGRICTLEAAFDTLDPAGVATLTTRVDTLSGALTTTVSSLTGLTLSGDLPAGLTAPVASALANLAGLGATVSGLGGTVTSLGGDLGALQTAVGDLQDQLGGVDAEALATQVGNLITALGADPGGLNPAAISDLQGQVDALGTSVSGIQSQVGAVDVVALSGTVSSVQSQVATIQTTLAGVCAAVAGQALPVVGSLPIVGPVTAGQLSATLPVACP